MTRLALETEGPTAGVAQFQQALSAHPGGERAASLHRWPQFVGSALGQAGFPAAALKHLELAGQLGGRRVTSRRRHRFASLKSNPAVSVWEKNPYRLWPAPDNATAAVPRIVRAGAGMGQRGALVVRGLGLRITGRRFGGGRDRRSQSGLVLPLDRRSRGGGRGAAAIHRPHRAHDRRRSTSRHSARGSNAVRPTITSNSSI